MKIFFITISLTFSFFTLQSQTMISFTESQDYNESRYRDIKESPYLFKTFIDGYIIGINDTEYDKVSTNFNAYTEEIEVRKGNKFIRLDERFYKSVLLKLEDGKDMKMIRGIHPFFRGKFIEVLYQEGNTYLTRKHTVKISETSVNNVGRKETFRRFIKEKELYLVTGTGSEDIQLLKTKKKKLLKALGKKDELTNYIKKEKIDLSSDKGLVSLIKYWISLEE